VKRPVVSPRRPSTQSWGLLRPPGVSPTSHCTVRPFRHIFPSIIIDLEPFAFVDRDVLFFPLIVHSIPSIFNPGTVPLSRRRHLFFLDRTRKPGASPKFAIKRLGLAFFRSFEKRTSFFAFGVPAGFFGLYFHIFSFDESVSQLF